MDQRYSRQIILPGWGVKGQQRLASSRVLVIGAGGLGSAVLSQLIAAGVGKLTFFDHDVVTRSNLNRQFLFKESDMGSNKAEAARLRLLELDAAAAMTAVPDRFDARRAEEFFLSHDLVLDCTDDPRTRIMLSDAAVLAGIPLVHASLFRFEGHLTVFHHTADGRYFTLRSLFPDYPETISSDCTTEGMAGPVALSLAAMQAFEAIKILVSIGTPLIGRLKVIDFLSNSTFEVEMPSDQGIRPEAPSSWDVFRKYHQGSTVDDLQLEVGDLEQAAYFMIDIREEHELNGRPVGLHVPMDEVRQKLSGFPVDRPWLFVCDRGLRSSVVAKAVRLESGRENVFSLMGGLEKYELKKSSRVFI